MDIKEEIKKRFLDDADPRIVLDFLMEHNVTIGELSQDIITLLCWKSTYVAHDKMIRRAVFSPDGYKIASCGEDGAIFIRDSLCQDKIRQICKYSSHVPSVDWSPDSQRIVGAAGDHGVVVWDADTGAVSRYFNQRSSQDAYSVKFSPNGRYVASGHSDGHVVIWDLYTLSVVARYQLNAGAVFDVCWRPDGRYIAAQCTNKHLVVFEPFTGRLCFYREASAPSLARRITFSPDGTRIVCPCDEKVAIIDSMTGQIVCYLFSENVNKYVTVAAWSPDGKYIAAGTDKGLVLIWDVTTGQEVLVLTANTYKVDPYSVVWGSVVCGVEYSPCSKQILIALWGGGIELWNVSILDKMGLA